MSDWVKKIRVKAVHSYGNDLKRDCLDLIKAAEIMSEALGRYAEIEKLFQATPNNQWAQSALKEVEGIRK